MKCGIIGLPNVGKSTLFSVLTGCQAKIADYPFCTIEPNQARVLVNDPRLDTLAICEKSQRIVPAYIDIVDIAGLVKGASKGEGMGNQFLSHVRNVDVLIHVLGAFRSASNIQEDQDIIQIELALADVAYLEKMLKQKNLEKEERETYLRAIAILNQQHSLTQTIWTEEEKKWLQTLTTIKPMCYVYNGEEGDKDAIVISASFALESQSFTEEEKTFFQAEVAQANKSLDQLIHRCYQLLSLCTFFTAGKQEARAWSIVQGTPASKAAGVIHSDFERLFIRAEVVSFQDFIDCQGWKDSKSKGKCRLEGKTYCIQDGEVLFFHTS